MARLILALAALTASHALCFAAAGWRRDWRAYRDQMRATATAVRDPQLRADAIAWHRRHLPRVLRLLPRLHLPRFHVRSH